MGRCFAHSVGRQWGLPRARQGMQRGRVAKNGWGPIYDSKAEAAEADVKRLLSDEVCFDNAAELMSKWKYAIDPAFRRPV
jgi:hypothetical protein